jgi:hypothetical protein
VTVAVNHTNNADGRGIDLVIDRVWEPPEENATKTTVNNGMGLRRFVDPGHRVVNGVEELPRRRA